MNKKITAIFVLALVTIPILTVTSNENITTLNKPTITGPTEGIFGKTYEYEISFEHSEGKDVYYRILWGDCTAIYRDGPFKSGEKATFSHNWCDICSGPGFFNIRVKAYDDYNGESEWGTIDVYMGRNKEKTTINSLFLQFLERLIVQFPMIQELLDFQ